MSHLRVCAVVFGALLSAFASESRAAKLLVANDGVDSETCGGKKAGACRSISQAIANASAGDTIQVGPGRYGDLTNDGLFTSPGEETGAAQGMIVVDKAVRIESTSGATVTVIDARNVADFGVTITANGARFGAPKRGFTVIGAGQTAVRTLGANGVTIAGNLAVGNGDLATVTPDAGFAFDGSGHTLLGNVSIGNEFGFVAAGSGSTLRGNVAVGNLLAGFSMSGGGNTLDRNVSSANGSAGMIAVVDSGGGDFTGNATIANADNGTALTGDGFDVKDLVTLGNQEDGLSFSNGVTLQGGGVYGNVGCGTRNTSGASVTAAKVYWGDPAGPGNEEPADRACDVGAGSTTSASPVSKKAPKLKMKPLF